MREFLIIKDAEVAKLLADETRCQILNLLKIKEMSTNQLAKILDKPASSIDHHLKVLKAAGLIELTSERRRGNIIERFYKASARHYIVSYSLSEKAESSFKDWNEKLSEDVALLIQSFGYNISDISKLTRLIEEFNAFKRMVFEDLASSDVNPSALKPPASFLLMDILTHLELYRSEKYRKLMDELLSIVSR
ncbi:winged helix-turn-helix transcriptional regulator [Candidatus Bathyarchaeota archaeon]|nr:winged helix-turn-helix transcriptional regulator [Candidatus Bathyarchaeota archaeon]